MKLHHALLVLSSTSLILNCAIACASGLGTTSAADKVVEKTEVVQRRNLHSNTPAVVYDELTNYEGTKEIVGTATAAPIFDVIFGGNDREYTVAVVFSSSSNAEPYQALNRASDYAKLRCLGLSAKLSKDIVISPRSGGDNDSPEAEALKKYLPEVPFLWKSF